MSDAIPYLPDLPVGHTFDNPFHLSDDALRRKAKRTGYWHCMDADGYRYVLGAIVDKDPQGRLVAAETCNPWGDRRTWISGPPWAETTPAQAYAQAEGRTTAQEREITMDRSDGRGTVFAALYHWVEAAAKNQPGCGGVFYLWGAPGRGKTVAVERSLLHVLRFGAHSTVLNAAEIVETMRKSYDFRAADAAEHAERWQQMLYTLNTARILAVDDLGLGKSVGAQDAESMWVQVLDTRHKTPGLATIFTANGSPDTVTKEARLASRLASGQVMELRGQDYRRARH